MKRRKEYKYFCTDAHLLIIENYIKGIMKRDVHQTGDTYNIRSIYFDNLDDKCFMENDAGVDMRSKYRIRTYDLNPDFIRAEIKIKYNDTCAKESTVIDREMYKSIMENSTVPFKDSDSKILTDSSVIDKYRTAIVGEGFRPATVIEYERTAYTYDIGNVRITFDKNISVSRRFENFFDENLHAIPMLPKGMHILEVKYDELLPDYLGRCINGLDLTRATFSKYYTSRLILKDQNPF